MGMMHVTQSYADNSDVYNNDNVDCRNALVAEYADGQHIFYLDMTPVSVIWTAMSYGCQS